MANVLVVIELCDGHALPVCLETLGQARRLSTKLGGTLYAVVPLRHAPSYGDGDMIEILAQHGADKVVLVTDEALGESGEMRWGTHGPAIAQVSDMLPPSLLLFGATPGAREVAPRAAARMGAAFLADAWLEVRDDRLHLWEGSGASARALDGDLEFPVVATVPSGRYEPASGDEEAEVEVLAAPGRANDFDELGWEHDPRPGALVLAPERDPSTFDGGWDAAPASAGLHEGAEALATALTGKVHAGAGADARLVISLGPPLDGASAEVKVAIHELAGTAHADYALVGEPVAQARALAAALGAEPAAPPQPTAHSAPAEAETGPGQGGAES